jgi:hypothetical protein
MQIINLVVARQNWFVDPDGKKKTVWYMPTEFAVMTTTKTI